MFEKLESLYKKYLELTDLISNPEVIADQASWRKYVKEQSSMKDVVDKYLEYKKVVEDMESAKAVMDDPELKEIASEEYYSLKEKIPALEEELKILLLPKDENDDSNVIIEIRAGAGGEEAALFAYNLYRMYTMYAELKRWEVEIIDINETEIGGIKEISFMIKGKGAYSRLKFESGVHRVQRVPETEASGRIHTSTATVAVLPEVEDVEIEINPNDLRIDTYRASGAGGQHVNKTSSAIRITHIPTGIVVSCQNERSQLQNKETAMKMLRSKLYEKQVEERDSQRINTRRLQVGSGARSEKIRTYNYPQSRVTDHRINYTIYQLETFLNDVEKIAQKIGQQRAGRNLAIKVYELAKKSVPSCPSNSSTQLILNKRVVALINLIETTNEIIAKMNEIAKSMDEYKEVRNMKGVGDRLAPLLIAEIGDIRRFKNAGSLIAYAGIDSPPYQSGKYEATNRHISKRGNKYLRKTGFEVMHKIIL